MIHKQITRFLFFPLLICAFFSCSENSNQNISDKNITIKMITHGQATDPFWSVVRNGAKDAAEKLGISLQYQSPQNFDMVKYLSGSEISEIYARGNCFIDPEIE